jgi:Uma2 family endonuclease
VSVSTQPNAPKFTQNLAVPTEPIWRFSVAQYHQTSKKRLYARAGIPVYWIVNLPEQKLEVYTEPIDLAQEPTYQQCQYYSLSDEVSVALKGREVGRLSVGDLLP